MSISSTNLKQSSYDYWFSEISIYIFFLSDSILEFFLSFIFLWLTFSSSYSPKRDSILFIISTNSLPSFIFCYWVRWVSLSICVGLRKLQRLLLFVKVLTVTCNRFPFLRSPFFSFSPLYFLLIVFSKRKRNLIFL